MKQKHKKIWYSIGVIVVFVLLLLFFVFFSKMYPAAIVGTSVITKKYWDQGIAIGKKLDPQASQQTIKDQIIKTKSEQELAIGRNIKPDLKAEFQYEITGKDKEFQTLLKNYFNSDSNLFKEFVTKPQAFDAAWRIEYNAHSDSNKIARNRAENILSRIKNGEPFEQLAKTESDDKITGQLGGDLGFVAPGEILPELEKAIRKAKLGEVSDNIVISRLGFHIIFPVETADKEGLKTWHLKHILIKTDGFESWINPMLNQLRVWYIK